MKSLAFQMPCPCSYETHTFHVLAVTLFQMTSWPFSSFLLYYVITHDEFLCDDYQLDVISRKRNEHSSIKPRSHWTTWTLVSQRTHTVDEVFMTRHLHCPSVASTSPFYLYLWQEPIHDTRMYSLVLIADCKHFVWPKSKIHKNFKLNLPKKTYCRFTVFILVFLTRV